MSAMHIDGQCENNRGKAEYLAAQYLLYILLLVFSIDKPKKLMSIIHENDRSVIPYQGYNGNMHDKDGE